MTAPARRRVATKPTTTRPMREPSEPLVCQSCGTTYRFVYGPAGAPVEMIDERTGRPHREVCSGSTADPRSPWGPVTTCSTCNAHILWCVTESGKKMPVDASMRERGNVTLTRRDDGMPLVTVGPPAVRNGFVSHFATCGQDDEHRRRELAGAAAAKEAAIQQADDHAPAEWKRQALAIVADICRHMPSFTADDVWGAGLTIPPTPSALGGVLRKAGALGYCEPTAEMVPTRYSRRHHDVRVWRSKVHEPIGSEIRATTPEPERADVGALAFEPVSERISEPADGLDFAPLP